MRSCLLATLFIVGASHGARVGEDEDCDRVAARMNAKFHGASRYDPQASDLPKHLDSNGILLSMCLTFEGNVSCSNSSWTHTAATWINVQTGLSVFDPEYAFFGYIIDPLAVDVLCAYPVDGATDFRDERGCGPLTFDALYGSHGNRNISAEERAEARAKYEEELHEDFGPGTTWRDINCTQWPWGEEGKALMNCTTIAPAGRTMEACNELKRALPRKDTPVRLEMLLSTENVDYGAILGHPMCVDDFVTCDRRPCSNFAFFAFGGPCSWAPAEWQAMVDSEIRLIPLAEKHGLKIWNEVVLPDSAASPEATAAVFWVKRPGMNTSVVDEVRQQARELAALRGGKAVLKLDAQAVEAGRHDVFSCSSRT